MVTRCDIVVPVHGSLDATDDCLRSVLRYTGDVPFRLLVVDDASDAFVARALDDLAREDARVTVLRNVENLGYLRSVNRGLSVSAAPFVCLLNSDTLVTPGWLGRMIRCAESDPRIAVVNPVSNAAIDVTVQTAPGLDVFTMAERVAACSRRDYPDVVTAVGFCFLLTCAAIERFGGFDEVYGHGYCEESDYCMRVTGAGLRTVVADDAFVYHRGGASFGPSARARYLANREVFDRRWGPRYEAEHLAFLRRDPLRYLREALTRDLERPRQPTLFAPAPAADYGPLERLGVMTVDAWQRGGVRRLLRKVPLIPRRVGEALRELAAGASSPANATPPETFTDPMSKQALLATPAYCRRLPRGRGLHVAVLVWKFDLCGGVLAVLDLVNQLVLTGNTVTLVTVGDEPAPGAFTSYARPLVVETAEALETCFPEVDLVVATFWPTAADWLPRLRRRRPALRAVYFLQDYEPWFYPESEVETRRRIIDSYDQADALVVTSPWLQAKLAEHGHASTVIPIGIDLRIFYAIAPRPVSAVKRVLVQARPFAPWRGFDAAIAALTRLAERRSDVQAVFFGCGDEDLAGRAPFAHENAGLVHDRNAVARLYRSCDVVFDPSTFQAFGLPGLEAMACGVPTVLPDRGGILQYARGGENTLLVDPDDVDGRVAALERLLDDPRLRARLVEAGRATAAAYSHEAMARRHVALYRTLAGPSDGGASRSTRSARRPRPAAADGSAAS